MGLRCRGDGRLVKPWWNGPALNRGTVFAEFIACQWSQRLRFQVLAFDTFDDACVRLDISGGLRMKSGRFAVATLVVILAAPLTGDAAVNRHHPRGRSGTLFRTSLFQHWQWPVGVSNQCLPEFPQPAPTCPTGSAVTRCQPCSPCGAQTSHSAIPSHRHIGKRTYGNTHGRH
jgi:hypothetical protein